MRDHIQTFDKLYANLKELIKYNIPDQQRFLIFEWPRVNDWWNKVEPMLKQYHCKPVKCEGCAPDVTSKILDPGAPHKKPWTIWTNVSPLAVKLGEFRCNHPKGFKRAPTIGDQVAIRFLP